MKFEKALKAMREGKKAATNNRFYERYFVDCIYINDDGVLMWHCVDDEDCEVDDCGLTGEEILSEDWRIVND